MELSGSVQGMIDLVGGGSSVEVAQVLTSGEKIATISVDNVPTDIYAPEGSEVEVSQVLTSGEKIATITVDNTPTDIYAPSPTAPTEVEVTQVVSSGIKIATISVDGDPTDIYAPSPLIYSTDEQVIGTWTNGKPLYSKMVSGTTSSDTSTTAFIADIGANAVIRFFKGLIDGKYDLNSYRGTDSWARTWVANDGHRLVNWATGNDYASKSCYVEVQYTKTTD